MNRARLFFTLAILLGSAPAQQPARGSEPTMNSERPGYVGDARCIECHKDVSLTYQKTSHHLASQLPTATNVLGSFRNPTNVLTINDSRIAAEPGLEFRMETKPNGLYETAISGWNPHLQQRSERIDVITGSGVRGQTYLYWQGDRLFELPVSYWTDGHRWINSPGYINGTADFSRPVYPACLECHATYVRPLSPNPATNRFDRESLVVGISCESCHGPGAGHVAEQASRKQGKQGSPDHAVLNPAKFSRDRQVDLCAECHNGIRREGLAPAFSYVPGHPLSDYFRQIPADPAEHPDVHGNQVGLLQRSMCYLSSPQMTCSTCHDVHSAPKAAASYSVKCLGCHQWQSCGMARQMGHTITNNCIDCHMPVEPTSVIVSQTADQLVRANMRNHWIKVYPETGHAPAKPATPRPLR